MGLESKPGLPADLRAIFLDLDDTLCDTRRADELGIREHALLIQRQNPEVDGESFLWDFMDALYGRRKTLHSRPSHKDELGWRHRVMIEVSLDHGMKWTLEQAVACYDGLTASRVRHFDFYPGVREMLQQLRQKFKLAVLTNGPACSQRWKIERAGLEKLVDVCYIGGEMPSQKPTPHMFEAALKALSVKASQVIHAGDGITTDVPGARSVGITPVWISHGRDWPTEGAGDRPEVVLNGVVELQLWIVGQGPGR